MALSCTMGAGVESADARSLAAPPLSSLPAFLGLLGPARSTPIRSSATLGNIGKGTDDDDDDDGMSLVMLITKTWMSAAPKLKCSHSSGFRVSRRTAGFPAGKVSGFVYVHHDGF